MVGQLEPAGARWRLRFVRRLPYQLGKAARDAAGWHARLDLLEHHLAGEPPPWDAGRRWAELHPGYVEHLPAEASTIGPPNLP
jgi:hypothetical protein